MSITTVNASISPASLAEPGYVDYRNERIAHWGDVARRRERWTGLGDYYHRRLADVYRFLVVPGQRVLEVGCGQADLLAGVQPAVGVGIDFSADQLVRARRLHPNLRLIEADAHDLPIEETFDVIILSDLVNDLWDVQTVLERLRPLCTLRTRLILNFYSHLWEKPLAAAQRLGLASRALQQNWLTYADIANLLHLTGFETMRHWSEVLWPVRTPLIDTFCNRYLVKLWPLRELGLTNMLIARPQPAANGSPAPTVSVIVPARNEAGNAEAIVDRLPNIGGGTELIFVEGHSSDDTYAAIERAMARHPDRACRLLRQSGRGKGDAVRLGFAHATGDILMILDADLTVPPEALPRFYEAIRTGKGEFINGVRLVYPMEKRAMRLLNLIGNKFFSVAFSWLLGQSVKDTLCGTKVLWRQDYEKLAANRDYFGDFDPFGDFDLLFGAAKMNLKIVDLPIRYRERTYGTTNIQRWKHGWLLVKMSAFAAGRIKFV